MESADYSPADAREVLHLVLSHQSVDQSDEVGGGSRKTARKISRNHGIRAALVPCDGAGGNIQSRRLARKCQRQKRAGRAVGRSLIAADRAVPQMTKGALKVNAAALHRREVVADGRALYEQVRRVKRRDAAARAGDFVVADRGVNHRERTDREDAAAVAHAAIFRARLVEGDDAVADRERAEVQNRAAQIVRRAIRIERAPVENAQAGNADRAFVDVEDAKGGRFLFRAAGYSRALDWPIVPKSL